ncbi:MAG: hypothetical protein LLG08_05650 [Actinomycetia bacterium]|nr:hypothetical protein [Actinomycetes bacterium]
MAIVMAPYKTAPERAEYKMTATTGAITTIAADGPVFSMRWTSSSLIAVIKRIGISVGVRTAYGTAQTTDYGLYFARSFTASDSGGTALTLTTDNGKLDTSFPTTAFAAGDVRISTTAVITAGTRTLDAQPMAITVAQTNALATVFNDDWTFGETFGRQPIILRQNEGIVIHNLFLMGATGVLRLYVTVEWAEVDKGAVK